MEFVKDVDLTDTSSIKNKTEEDKILKTITHRENIDNLNPCLEDAVEEVQQSVKSYITSVKEAGDRINMAGHSNVLVCPLSVTSINPSPTKEESIPLEENIEATPEIPNMKKWKKLLCFAGCFQPKLTHPA
uniref:Uncharacterized protein n=1 Tax=Clastoptera arizonana TaxID=38151 RepID=A0A1B6CBQ5_9HEMI